MKFIHICLGKSCPINGNHYVIESEINTEFLVEKLGVSYFDEFNFKSEVK